MQETHDPEEFSIKKRWTTVTAARCTLLLRSVGRRCARPDAPLLSPSAHLPAEPRSVRVSGLLRELIHRASEIPVGTESEPRNARLLQLLVDEIEVTPQGALHLPTGKDPRLAKICDALLANPGDDKDLADR